jgi:formate dehydrogenase iron-sulfur subunit
MTLIAEMENRTLIEKLLEEQRQLTAVEKFSRQHDRNEIPHQQKHYRDLIPLVLPKAGEQFAFEVDLDACSGCKACVTACHSLNGLDENETWRKVGVLTGRNKGQPFQQTVTTACHHCAEPGCLNGCPVEAYEKDFSTGIVRHLDDQCIGCQYCSWMCPYDVPQYSSKRGIVRKCDMCYSRLSVGEAPACVQACPSGAITIQIIRKAEAAAAAAADHFLPTAPDPKLTIPTTRYVSAKPLPDSLRAGDQDLLQKQPAHWPLILMLLATQASVGIFGLNVLVRIFAPDLLSAHVSRFNILLAGSLGLVGLAASVFHLGRPLQAWRSFLGWRHSWLSREVLAFGMFGLLVCLYAAAEALSLSRFLTFSLSLAVPATGLLGVICSVMVYHATKRDFWNFRFSGGRFFGTTVIFGLAGAWATSAAGANDGTTSFAMGLMVATLAKCCWELSFFRILDKEMTDSLSSTARLMQKMRPINGLRFIVAAVGGILLPVMWVADPKDFMVPLLGCVFCILGELAERYLFFTAVSSPKMPGGGLAR